MISVFVFYDMSSGIQAPLAFSKVFRHCNLFNCSDDYQTIQLDFNLTGIITRFYKFDHLMDLMHTLRRLKKVTAIVVTRIVERQKTKWKPFWVRSCNEVCRYGSGINVGFTFNPKQLYGKLLKYDRRRNYEILEHWRRNDGDVWRRFI